MAEAATTQVTPPNTNGTGTSNNITQAAPSASKPAPSKNNVQRENNTTGNAHQARGGRQNYNNRANNNNNNNPPGGGSNDKNPRRGKRFTRKTNNNSNDGVKASSQGDDYRAPPATVNAGNSNPPPPLSSASANPNVRSSAIPNGGVQKSWSNVVSSNYGQAVVQQHNGAEPQAQNQVVKHENVTHGQVNNQNHDSNNKRQNRPKKTGNKFEEKKGKPDETDNFNPDEKIQAIEIQLDKTLNDMQAKADMVKQLQEQIKTIRAERDGKIDELNTERANIIEELKKLNTELSDTNHQISTIISTITQLKTNRIQKVRSLVDHSRALLNDKAI